MKTLPLIFALLISVNLSAQKFQDLAQTPPMGWNSWNYFECDDINETVVKEVADAMVSSGMKDAGYQYINIDDCWQVGRDANGKIIVDSVKFPSGIKPLADYIHGKGLKFGLVTAAVGAVGAKVMGENHSEEEMVELMSTDGTLVQVPASEVQEVPKKVNYNVREGYANRKFVMVIDLAKCRNALKCQDSCNKNHN